MGVGHGTNSSTLQRNVVKAEEATADATVDREERLRSAQDCGAKDSCDDDVLLVR
jgi:hypothetical protein